MKKPVRVAVTGPAGNIGYALLFRIAAGDMLGPDQPVILQLLERNTPESAARLKGVMMELADCAFPLLADMTSTADPMIAFKDADAAMSQINLKNYPERFTLSGLPVVKVGISFDAEEHTLGDWLIEK